MSMVQEKMYMNVDMEKVVLSLLTVGRAYL